MSKTSKKSSKKKSPTGKHKFVFSFGSSKVEGKGTQKDLLGGKGANLHEMTLLELPVPSGFTLSTEVCSWFYENQKTYPSTLKKQVQTAIARLEKEMGKKFGDNNDPLLVSVRSGAPVSMPGMMDTVLNLGLNDKTVQGLIKQSGDARFSYDSYRRFVSMYADVVLGIHSSYFESVLEEMKANKGCEQDTELSADDLAELVLEFKNIILSEGKIFPEDPMDQLWGAISAVFNSWMNPRAITYRQLNNISSVYGTAVNIQAMVFGNMGNDCSTGVAFTRDPSSGERKFFGEYLINAQGEDVVAGVRTPMPINKESCLENSQYTSKDSMEFLMPKAYKKLVTLYKKLEKHYCDMQDIEFTVEKGRLFLLQTRSGKRTAQAALRIAVDMVKERLISKKDALLRVQPEQLDQLLHPCLDPDFKKEVIAKGLPASPGASVGQVVFDPDTAQEWAEDLGRKVVLVRVETSPEDIHGMSCSEGILTTRGGMTSHAAVVARGMGRCCVSGCGSIAVNYEKKEFIADGVTIKEGDYITIDGSSGDVILGKVPVKPASVDGTFAKLMSWADAVRKLKIRTNADNAEDSKLARSFGAEGIGLCRTEHMFFDVDRIDAVREMILSSTYEGRLSALDKILPMQREDFKKIFQAMNGLPVTVRLLDPPLHEFVPQKDDELKKLAEKMSVSFGELKRKVEELHEFNPMLGHRGCRLGISFPEIYRTQVRAIIEAVCELKMNDAMVIKPEIMIPLVGDWRELKIVGDICRKEASDVIEEYSRQTGKKLKIQYSVGTMIELPRAALTAGEIAKYGEFFSFGTNDLTQTTYGLSRDDSGKFLKDYIENNIYENDPFAKLDQSGVGLLLDFAVKQGRKTRPDLKLGICGEHGGEPSSVEFCHKLGLDYVSCSPYRVPIARLAAAQAALKFDEVKGVRSRVKKTKDKKKKVIKRTSKRARRKNT